MYFKCFCCVALVLFSQAAFSHPITLGPNVTVSDSGSFTPGKYDGVTIPALVPTQVNVHRGDNGEIDEIHITQAGAITEAGNVLNLSETLNAVLRGEAGSSLKLVKINQDLVLEEGPAAVSGIHFQKMILSKARGVKYQIMQNLPKVGLGQTWTSLRIGSVGNFFYFFDGRESFLGGKILSAVGSLVQVDLRHCDHIIQRENPS